MKKILVVEDSADFQMMVRRSLGQDGFTLTMVGSLSEAQKKVQDESFDLIILDITLPDGDGFELCSALQAEERLSQIPVIFMTAHEDVSKKVAAFALGAEDYIVKPFNMIEFKARVEAKLKRGKGKERADQVLIRGSIKVNILEQRAYLIDGGKESELNLTPLEFKILSYLTRNEGSVLSRDQILVAVWGQNVHVYDRTVDTHISALRKKLTPYGSYIQAVLGSGYCFSSQRAEKKAS